MMTPIFLLTVHFLLCQVVVFYRTLEIASLQCDMLQMMYFSRITNPAPHILFRHNDKSFLKTIFGCNA